MQWQSGWYRRCRFYALLSGLAALGGCDTRDATLTLPEGAPYQVAPHTVDWTNDRGESLMGVLFLPDNEGPVPAVVVLHGSGGLFSDKDNGTRIEMAPQFEEWAAVLVERGYAVLFPSSFYSRGYLEWSDRPAGLSKDERLIFRVYDAHAALAYACSHPAIDCDRMGLLGFSNGASTVLMAIHNQLDQVEEVAGLSTATQPQVALGVAYYPGCGLHGFVSLNDEDPSEFYFPRVPVVVHHAEDDSLLEDCQVRLDQTRIITHAEKYSQNPFDLHVYGDTDHGFDSSPDNRVEELARDRARTRTLEFLDRL